MTVTGATAYEGALHLEARRGVNTVTFEVPGGRRDEAPIIPQRLLSAKFRGKDGAKQAADKKKGSPVSTVAERVTLKITG
jgi:hypothetical protein